MKLSSKTINVLQNFSSINQSLMFRKGSVISTMAPTKTIIAEVTVDDEFEQDFGIYDLGQFLSAFSLVEDANFDFGEESLTISDDCGTTLEYRYTDESMIVTPPEDKVTFPDVDVKFTLSEENLKSVLQAARVLGLPEIIVKGRDGKITISAGDTKNSSMNSFIKTVGKTDKEFQHIFKVDNMKMMMLEYNVEISSDRISKFSTADGLVTYFVAKQMQK